MTKPGQMLSAFVLGAALCLAGIALLRVGLQGSDWRVIPGAASATLGLYFGFFSVERLFKRGLPGQIYRGMDVTRPRRKLSAQLSVRQPLEINGRVRGGAMAIVISLSESGRGISKEPW